MRILSVLSFVAISVCAIAQNSPPAFEAASIKPNKSAGARPREEFSPGRYTATNVTLRESRKGPVVVIVIDSVQKPSGALIRTSGASWVDPRNRTGGSP